MFSRTGILSFTFLILMGSMKAEDEPCVKCIGNTLTSRVGTISIISRGGYSCGAGNDTKGENSTISRAHSAICSLQRAATLTQQRLCRLLKMLDSIKKPNETANSTVT
ncbi:hypothetical protein D915_003121 [Fasciola hepatica]|uniref:Uncharacterized protein n=1 Tax=Fasciola hepatica TaxID=6192 RepID=A0A4E0RJH5_FASHE|nr:hypothetical protein D915_003121 [Fasciola hepatica]